MRRTDTISHFRLAPVVAMLVSSVGGAGSVDHVIHISVDGLHSGYLSDLVNAQPNVYDNFARLVNESASTLNARTDYFRTITLPNHTSMITGRPVLQPADDNTLHHGYTSNSNPPTDVTLHNVGNPNVSYIASTFDIAHDYGLSTALYATKSKFVLFEQSYNVTAETPGGRPDQYLANGDQGINKIDTFFTMATSNSTNMVTTFIDDMATDPYAYTFMHLVEPDTFGHGSGWGSPNWANSVSRVDDLLGEIFSLIDNNPTLDGNTAIVLTSDHGGTLFGHSDPSLQPTYTIPFFVWGGPAEAGGDLYALNPFTRQEPGLGRPEYTEPVQPIRNGDSGNLALSLLGLPAVDGSSINFHQDLIISQPANAEWNGDDPTAGVAGDGATWNDERNWTRDGDPDRPFLIGDRVMFRAGATLRQVDLQRNRMVASVDFQADYQVSGGDLTVTGGKVTVDGGVTATIESRVESPNTLFKQGTGTLQIAGTASGMQHIQGTVSGSGTVQGALVSFDAVAPGDATGGVGTLTVEGVYSQGFFASLAVEIESTTPGIGHDQLAATSTAFLGGELAVAPLAGGSYADPAVRGQRDEFAVVTARSRNGVFRSLVYDGVPLAFDFEDPDGSVYSHQGAGLFRTIRYTNREALFSNYLALPGDADGDGSVTASGDGSLLLTALGQGAGQTWIDGDFDADGMVTASADGAILLTGLSTDQGTAAANPGHSQSVPEPATCIILVLGVALLGWRSLASAFGEWV